MTENKNLSAFPNTGGSDITMGDLGLSKREKAALDFACALIASGNGLIYGNEDAVCEEAIGLADTLFNKLENTSI